MRLLFDGCRRGLRENDARNMHVYLGDGDAGHVLDCVLDRLLQRLRHLWNIRAIFQVDTDIDNGNIVVEADLNRTADASSFQQALNRRLGIRQRNDAVNLLRRKICDGCQDILGNFQAASRLIVVFNVHTSFLLCPKTK